MVLSVFESRVEMQKTKTKETTTSDEEISFATFRDAVSYQVQIRVPRRAIGRLAGNVWPTKVESFEVVDFNRIETLVLERCCHSTSAPRIQIQGERPESAKASFRPDLKSENTIFFVLHLYSHIVYWVIGFDDVFHI